TTRNHSVSSCASPSALRQERLEATRKVVTAWPCGVKRISGSAPSRPVSWTLFNSFAIGELLPFGAAYSRSQYSTYVLILSRRTRICRLLPSYTPRYCMVVFCWARQIFVLDMGESACYHSSTE